MPGSKGPEGHSDGDVLIHAVCDAVLGAMGEEGIGVRFPDTDPAYKDVSSIRFLQDIKGLMHQKGYGIGNLDCVVIAESPRIATYREEIIATISNVLEVAPNDVNVKGKTSEKLGEIGEGDAVAAFASVLLEKK